MSLRGFISDRGPFLRRTIPQLSQLGNRPALRSAFSRGETCQYLGGFHQLGRCAREGREGGTRSGFIDLALCFAFPVAVSLEGQMTLQSPPVDRVPICGVSRAIAGTAGHPCQANATLARPRGQPPPRLSCRRPASPRARTPRSAPAPRASSTRGRARAWR